MGINRNFPRVVAHSPIAYQGLNLPNLFMEQLILHICTLVKYGSYPNNITGNLIRANAELLQLETGMCGPLFQILTIFQACVTPTWVSQCWAHCTQYGIDIMTDLPMNMTKKSWGALLKAVIGWQTWPYSIVVAWISTLYFYQIFAMDLDPASNNSFGAKNNQLISIPTPGPLQLTFQQATGTFGGKAFSST